MDMGEETRKGIDSSSMPFPFQYFLQIKERSIVSPSGSSVLYHIFSGFQYSSS